MMEANHEYVVEYKDRKVVCYGELQEDSNFNVVCDDECDDNVWCDGDPISGGSFLTWEAVILALQPHFESDILEISAC